MPCLHFWVFPSHPSCLGAVFCCLTIPLLCSDSNSSSALTASQYPQCCRCYYSSISIIFCSLSTVGSFYPTFYYYCCYYYYDFSLMDLYEFSTSQTKAFIGQTSPLTFPSTSLPISPYASFNFIEGIVSRKTD